MKQYRYIILVFLLVLGTLIRASDRNTNFDMTSIGGGFGMDYGGIGGSILCYPQKNIGLFAAYGKALISYEYNVGLKLRLITDNTVPRICPYLLGMYGYNTVIEVKDSPNENRIFYGTTIGCGFDIRIQPTNIGYFTLALLLPLRGANVTNYIESLTHQFGMQVDEKLSKIGFSIGYRFIINRFNH